MKYKVRHAIQNRDKTIDLPEGAIVLNYELVTITDERDGCTTIVHRPPQRYTERPAIRISYLEKVWWIVMHVGIEEDKKTQLFVISARKKWTDGYVNS